MGHSPHIDKHMQSMTPQNRAKLEAANLDSDLREPRFREQVAADLKTSNGRDRWAGKITLPDDLLPGDDGRETLGR